MIFVEKTTYLEPSKGGCMPYQKILKVTSENKCLNIYVDDGYGSRLTSYGYGNLVPTVVSQNQYGALVSWYNEYYRCIEKYEVVMAGATQEAIISSGDYIPDGWQEEVKRLYYEYLPQPEERNVGEAPSQEQTNPIPQKKIGNAGSSIHLKSSLKSKTAARSKKDIIINVIGKICAFGSISLSVAGTIAVSINIVLGIAMLATAILLAIFFVKCQKWKDDSIGTFFAVIAVLSSIAGCIFIFHIPVIGIMSLITTILSFIFSFKYCCQKRNAVLAFFIMLFLAAFIIPLSSEYQTVAVCNTPQDKTSITEKNSPSQKLSPYLQGVDDIEDADELGRFYYKIASDFYKNEMGLKGSPEQIDAGNKVMSDVYGFLGLSLSKGEIQNVDSIKAVIQNNAVISDYRKKKAIEELEFGIETIESFQ